MREISGCALDPARVRFVTPGWGGRLPRWRGRFALWAHAAAVRYARRIAPEYDLVISTMGECPINAPHCLQILHFPIYSIREEHLKFLGISIRNRLHYLARVAYTLIGRAICGWNRGALRRARTIVNSDWTGRIVRELYGVTRVTRIWPKSNVLATPDSPQWVPFNAREDAFVMLGRIHPSKRIEQGIKVIERLRARQHEVKLHVVGIVSDEGYFERLRRRVEGKDFVTYHLGLSRADLEGLVLRCRYGLHAHEHEHFGIAAAEMQ
ncbi:MAG TPA: glycosyltransferase, partial [Dehalococcoidia bacterium]|nr:glycosyltransferase [Dehalococcoidia bacterium]